MASYVWGDLKYRRREAGRERAWKEEKRRGRRYEGLETRRKREKEKGKRQREVSKRETGDYR